jgi:hydroxymethylpyrimidine pyrophosphatase-like HAD family hydrolase
VSPRKSRQRAYRVVATDLDGTLLRSDGSVSAYTRQLLLKAGQAGVRVVLVTARPIEATREIARQVRASAAVCLSGAITYDMRSDQVQDSVPLAPSQIRLLRKEVRSFCDRVAWGYETPMGRHVDEQWDWRASGLSKERMTCLLGSGAGPRRDVLSMLMSCRAHDGNCLRNWLAAYGNAWGAAYSPVAGVIEVTTRTATKAQALARYCRAQGTMAREVVAFGDSLNDLTMLKWAGLGFAVANAQQELLVSIGNVAPSNDADGVAQVLGRLLAGQPCPSSSMRSCSSRLHHIGAASPA